MTDPRDHLRSPRAQRVRIRRMARPPRRAAWREREGPSRARRPPGTPELLSGRDVLIDPERVSGVVLRLGLAEPLVARAVVRSDAVHVVARGEVDVAPFFGERGDRLVVLAY